MGHSCFPNFYRGFLLNNLHGVWIWSLFVFLLAVRLVCLSFCKWSTKIPQLNDGEINSWVSCELDVLIYEHEIVGNKVQNFPIFESKDDFARNNSLR